MVGRIWNRGDPSRRLLCEIKKNGNEVDMERVEKLIRKKGADVNCKDPKNDWMPLGIACANGNIELVRLLLECGASKHVARCGYRRKGVTPLFVACREGHLDIAKTLLERNAPADGQCDLLNGSTPMYIACFNGHIDIVKLLRDNGANINPRSGTTPLYVASHQGHVEIVKFLLNKGACVNRDSDCHMMTPLYAACDNGHFEVAKLLLEKGADMDMAYNNRTPWEAASEKKHWLILNLLRQEELIRAKPDYSFLKSFDDHSIASQRFLEEVGKKTAIDTGRIEELIFEEDADVDCIATNGWTPLYWACSEGHYYIAKLLLENAADPDRRNFDDDNSTPLFKACRNGHLKIVELLLAYDAYVDCVSGMGGGWRSWTPLVWACSEGKSDLVRILLRNKANVNYQTGNRGTTPLFVACSKGHLDIVRMLLEKNACRSITRQAIYHNDMDEILFPEQNYYAMDLATRNGHTHIVDALR